MVVHAAGGANYGAKNINCHIKIMSSSFLTATTTFMAAIYIFIHRWDGDSNPHFIIITSTESVTSSVSDLVPLGTWATMLNMSNKWQN